MCVYRAKSGIGHTHTHTHTHTYTHQFQFFHGLRLVLSQFRGLDGEGAGSIAIVLHGLVDLAGIGSCVLQVFLQVGTVTTAVCVCLLQLSREKGRERGGEGEKEGGREGGREKEKEGGKEKGRGKKKTIKKGEEASHSQT